MGDQKQALQTLHKSLAMAEDQGYVRIFVDEGEPMRKLLLAYVHASLEYKNYAQKLLAAFAAPGLAAIRSEAKSADLIEPLTAREVEVLRAMAEGFSNHEIAEKLILAEGTVKFYVHAVLAKLGVHNRTQAVIEGKKQNII
jgi:LuxR family maltose regulon positive regulatory protein